MQQRLIHAAFIAAACAMGASAHAERIYELEELVITADPLSDIDSHLGTPASVLSKEDLLRRDSRSIGEAIEGTLGVTASDFGPSVGRPVIRGLSGARVRVLNDGIGTLDVSTLSPDHGVALEPVFADQVEIFRGPATLLYGSGASGGLVNVAEESIPTALPDGVSGSVLGQYDSVSDGWLGAIEAEAGLGEHIGVHVDAMTRGTDNYDIPGFGERFPDGDGVAGTLENSDVDTSSFGGGVSLIGARGFIGIAVSKLENNYGVPGHAHEGEEEGGVRIDQEQTRIDIKGAVDAPLPGIRRVQTRWGINDHTHLELEGGVEVGTQLENDAWEGRIEVLHDRIGNWDGVLGVQLSNRDFESFGEEAFVPASEQDSYAVFLFEKADIGAFHLDAGIRYEYTDSSTALAAADFGALSLSGGVTFEYMEGREIGVALTRAERAPAIEELFAGGPHLATNSFEIGDAQLDEETSLNIDLFWRGSAGRFSWTINAFYNAIDDFTFLAENDRNGDGIADRVEEDFFDTGTIVNDDDALLLLNQLQQDASLWGAEAELALRLVDDARGTLDGRIWADYVRGELDDAGNLPRITPARIGFNLDAARGPVSAGLALTHVFEQDETALLETTTDSYTMLNLDAAWQLPLGGAGGARLFLRATNLLDEEARRHTSFLKDDAPLPGRGVVVGARLTF